MNVLTLDASAAAAWLLPDEASDAADLLYQQVLGQQTRLQAPGLWSWEVGNLLRMAARRGRLSDADCTQAIAQLGRAQVQLEGPPDEARMQTTLTLARQAVLTYYDASYLEQALRTGTGLATKDSALRQAALRAGVPCIPL
ncbi:MAG: type II toxin-antitoxin system VapC family toxin [Chitinophagaceae bacterium]|nr:type II toxin-antitoxin system VapC family toxin [Rubrivivax sp.]